MFELSRVDYRSGWSKSLDASSVVALIVVWFFCVVWRYDAMPLLLWDESRNVANASSLLTSGQWLVPYFDGAPDHWNTKPPLLIWCIAALMKVGLPLILATRLPSMLAVLLTGAMVWGVCRFMLKDGIAAFASVTLMLVSYLYVGRHVGRTGDYDALLIMFTVCAVIGFWRSVVDEGPVRMRWFAVCGVALFFGVMTKGVAAGFALPGMILFAALTGRLLKLVGDWRVWVLSLVVAGLCAGYYLSRELYDPGYLHIVWQNELGGRFATTLENHVESPTYYVWLLARHFEPGCLLLPLCVLPLMGRDPRRRALTIATLVIAATIIAILSGSRTKLYWYAAPAVPLLAIAAGIGVSDALQWVAVRYRLQSPAILRPMGLALIAVCTVAALMVNSRDKHSDMLLLQARKNGQLWYDRFFQELEQRGNARDFVVVDTGLNGAPPDYNPLLDTYVRGLNERGYSVTVERSANGIGDDVMVVSCDPRVLGLLSNWHAFSVSFETPLCVAGVKLSG